MMGSRKMQTQFLDNYEISTDLRRLNIDVIHHFLAKESYWSPGIPRGIVQRAIENSLCFGVYDRTEQVGFARVVTDKSTFALLADVFIVSAHRSKGLSKWLMRCVVGHEDLQGLRRFLLFTTDAHGLYAQVGFKEIGNPARVMEILRQDIHQSP
jgi:N-acetylglutamate synthase-like GNAT family acetyltransferase